MEKKSILTIFSALLVIMLMAFAVAQTKQDVDSQIVAIGANVNATNTTTLFASPIANVSTFPDCMRNAITVRNTCYDDARSVKDTCAEQVRNSTQKSVRSCNIDYKTSMSSCKDTFQEGKRTCLQIQHTWWEGFKAFFD